LNFFTKKVRLMHAKSVSSFLLRNKSFIKSTIKNIIIPEISLISVSLCKSCTKSERKRNTSVFSSSPKFSLKFDITSRTISSFLKFSRRSIVYGYFYHDLPVLNHFIKLLTIYGVTNDKAGELENISGYRTENLRVVKLTYFESKK
jgi:hypothetical protein